MKHSTHIVRDFYRHLRSGDGAAAGTLLSADVVLHVPGRHPLAGDYRGPEGVAAFAVKSRAIAADGEELAVIDVLSGDAFVAAVCRVDAQRPGGARLVNRTVHLARVEEGRIAEIWFHNFDQHTVDAFWGARHDHGRQ